MLGGFGGFFLINPVTPANHKSVFKLYDEYITDYDFLWKLHNKALQEYLI
jgi:hypothetical protein